MSTADAYRKILNGVRIEDTGLDEKSMKKLKLFMLYIDRDMLQADIRKKTGLSRSSVYQLNKVRNEHKSKAIAYYLQSSLSDSYQV